MDVMNNPINAAHLTFAIAFYNMKATFRDKL